MRDYKKVTKSYETDELTKCTCDKCGKECTINNNDFLSKRTAISINPIFTSGFQLNRDLCPDCTKELAKWFNQDEIVKEFIEELDFWEKD